MHVPLHMFAHLGAKPDLHVLDIPGLLGLGPKVHGLVSALQELLIVAKEDKVHAAKGLPLLHTLAEDDWDLLDDLNKMAV